MGINEQSDISPIGVLDILVAIFSGTYTICGIVT